MVVEKKKEAEVVKLKSKRGILLLTLKRLSIYEYQHSALFSFPVYFHFLQLKITALLLQRMNIVLLLLQKKILRFFQVD